MIPNPRAHGGARTELGKDAGAKPMLDCMGEPEDADPAKARSVIHGCEGLESTVYLTAAEALTRRARAA